MCSHFETVSKGRVLSDHFKINAPIDASSLDVWPGTEGIVLRQSAQGSFKADIGVFGLIPQWSKDQKITRYTYNARTETVADKPSFKEAWAQHQHCIIPAMALYEPDWRQGMASPARISHRDGSPLCVAGLWNEWCSAEGKTILSFTMLTINATDHPVMNQFHRPLDEKRSVVLLPLAAANEWLTAKGTQRQTFFKPYAAELLCSQTQEIQSPQNRLF
jgi:putative SOS response-associated peptidase YedK